MPITSPIPEQRLTLDRLLGIARDLAEAPPS
jgi:hypothetical protein